MKKQILQLFNKIGHNMAIYDLNILHHSQEEDLSFNSLLYLDIISAYPGKYTSSHLADLLCVARPAVTQKINKLEKHGYLIKKQSKTDKRIFYLYATEKLSIMRDEEQVLEKMIQRYSKSEIQQFCEMMDFLAAQYVWDKTKKG